MKKLLLTITLTIASLAVFAQGMRNIGANIVIESGAYMYIDGDANGTYKNETTGSDHGEIDLDGSIIVEGDWLNNASSGNALINNTSPTWGTVYFNGTSVQNIGGSKSTHFENIELNNSTKTLTADSIEINNSLYINTADLNLNQKVLIFDHNVAANVTANSGYGIISESTTANFGIVHWKIGATTGIDYIIPFISGVGGTDIPFTYVSNSGATGSLRVATYGTPVNNTPFPPTVNHLQDATTGADNSAITADRFFMVEVSGTGVNADLTFETTPAEAAATTNPRAQRWIAAFDHWEAPTGVQSNPTANSVNATGVTAFNTWWVLAPLANPLPIDLLTFDANCHINSVTVEWSTASETNNDFFTIEKSMDRINFETVAIIPGAGNSNKTLHYSIVDNSLLAQTSYYRLTQTDYNGQSKTFRPVSVKPCNQQTAWNLVAIQGQSSAVRLTFQSSINEKIDIEIFDLLGNKIAQENIELFGGYQAEELHIANLIPGIYVGTAKTDDDMQTLKFVVRD